MVLPNAGGVLEADASRYGDPTSQARAQMVGIGTRLTGVWYSRRAFAFLRRCGWLWDRS